MEEYNYHRTKDVLLSGKKVPIDIGCVELVQFFNKVGLTTKFSCENQNNRLVIMFEDNIQDVDIENFIERNEINNINSLQIGSFKKWTRKLNGSIKSNWQYIADNEREGLIDYKKWIKNSILYGTILKIQSLDNNLEEEVVMLINDITSGDGFPCKVLDLNSKEILIEYTSLDECAKKLKIKKVVGQFDELFTI